MKKVIWSIVILFSLISASAQKWENTIGEPYQNEHSRRILEHYDKGYLITGQLEEHGWLIKTNINGNVLWNQKIGDGPDRVITTKTVYDIDGNLYIFGFLEQDLPDEWPVTVKLNACGELQWCALSAFTEYDDGSFKDGIILENGDLLGLANMVNEEYTDFVHLVCISPEGEFKWKKSYASRTEHPQIAFCSSRRIQQFDDIFIISGYVYTPYPGPDSLTQHLRPMFIGIDSLFNEQWVLEFGIADSMLGKALTSIPINDSLFMGTGRHRYIDSTGMTKDAWAMYYNDKGEQIGYTTITKDKLGSEVNESTFYEVERVNDSKYIATAGFFYGENEDEAMGEIVFDTAGNVYNYALREETAGGNSGLVKTFDNKYAIANSYWYPDLSYDVYLYKINDSLEHDTLYTANYEYDSLCTELPIQSGIIDLAGCDIVTSLEEIPTLEEYNNHKSKIIVNAFPNPVSDGNITLHFQNTEYFNNMELKCFDVFGKEIHSEKVYQYQGESILNIQNWETGIYFVIVYVDGKPSGECKFVVW